MSTSLALPSERSEAYIRITCTGRLGYAEPVLTGEGRDGLVETVGIRAVAVLAVTLVTVLALAAAAYGEITSFKGNASKLKDACEEAGGVYEETSDGSWNSCDTGQADTFCDATITSGPNCWTVSPRKKQALDHIQKQLDIVLDPQVRTVSGPSKVWEQAAPTNVDAVGVMQGGGCSGLGGEFVASPDGALGGCRTSKGTVICAKTTCSGFADTKKLAASTRKAIRAEFKTTSTTTPGASTPGGSTTTSGSATTTRATTTTRPTTPTTRG
jgi:hypothetical protein